MRSKNSTSKKIFSASMAFSLLLNTACGSQTSLLKPKISTFGIEEFLREEVGTPRGEVNPVDPVLVEESVDEGGNQTFTFELPGSGVTEQGAIQNQVPEGLPRIYNEMNQDGDLVENQREYLRGHAQRVSELREACKSVNCDGIPGLDGQSPGATRVGRDGIDGGVRTDLKTRQDVIVEIERLENELQAERAQWEKIKASVKDKQAKVEREHKEILLSVESSMDHATGTTRGQNESSTSVFKELIENHNSQVEKLYKNLFVDHSQVSADSGSSPLPQRPATPFEEEIQSLNRANEKLRATSFNTALNDGSLVFAELAMTSAHRGNLSSYDLRLATARAFAAASQHRGSVDENALKVSLGLAISAKSLEAQGLFALADESANIAKTMLQAALDLARLIPLIDLPLSIMEAFSGKTIDLTADGQTFLRDCTTLERGFALGTLVIGTGGVLIGAGPVALAAGAAGKVLKAFKEQSAAVHGAARGAQLFDETVLAAREIERTAPSLMAHSTLSPYDKKHIWLGEIRYSHDKSKVRLDGGMHTQDGLNNFLNSAPLTNQPSSRELLSNGVERVVFPESALTPRERLKLSAAASHGFGKENGKTLFPVSWTPSTIDAAVLKASTSGKVVSITEKGSKREVVHEGVVVIVNYSADGRPRSAFPSWNQGDIK